MPRVPGYHVVMSSWMDGDYQLHEASCVMLEFEERVYRLKLQGWTPVGGISFVTNPSCSVKVMRAMVLEPVDKEIAE